MHTRHQDYSTRGGLAASSFLLVVAAALLAGCASSSPPASRVTHSITAVNQGCRLDREEHVSLGRIALSLLKPVVRLAGESDAAATLSMIDRVEVATYRLQTPGSCSGDGWVDDFGAEMSDAGWRRMMMERDGDESSWVFARGGENGELQGLYVIAVDRHELEVVRIEGRIDRLMAEAMADEPFAAGELIGLASPGSE